MPHPMPSQTLSPIQLWHQHFAHPHADSPYGLGSQLKQQSTTATEPH